MNVRRRAAVWLPSLLALLLLLGILSLGTGPVPIPAAVVVDLLLEQETALSMDESSHRQVPSANLDRQAAAVIMRQLLAALVGASLALSGAVMQGFFQNPMADPYIIGVSSGAALGATLALTLSISFWIVGLHATSLFAFAGALLVTFIVYTVSVRAGRVPATLLLLTGVAVGSMAAAATSFIMLSGDDTLHAVLYWILGSFSSRRWEHVHMVWPSLLGAAVVLQVYARDLNVLLQGEENAQYLGVDVERLKRIFLVLTAWLTAAAVSVSGIIGFVGLIVPHMMRLLVGPDHRVLFPASLLGGAILMVCADMLARTVTAPAEVPVGIVTALIGCPFFLYLLSRRRELAL